MTDAASWNVDSHGLARYRPVAARVAVGGDEPTNFTPWLARNIDVLGGVLDLDLRVLDDPDDEVVVGRHIEIEVGGYYLDILASDGAGRTVAIENQYGTGDHRHLGQLLTYGGGVGADVLIWVAERFSDQHLETLRWLNERSDDQCGFFAVRAEFLRVGDSPPAPVFKLEVGPSEWARIRREVQKSTDRWSLESFFKAGAADRDLVVAFLDLVTGGEQVEGAREPIWFGARPNGSIFVHPRGARYAPVGLWVNSQGRVVVTGAWKNYGPPIAHHAGYRHVAAVLGQDHTGPASGVPLASLDVSGLYAACERTALELEDVVEAAAAEQ